MISKDNLVIVSVILFIVAMAALGLFMNLNTPDELLDTGNTDEEASNTND